MARPKKLLPAPCPCGEKYGTVQIVLFNNKYIGSKSCLIVRIRHYRSKYYQRIRDRKKNKAKGGLYRKQWHSFRLEYNSHVVNVDGEEVMLKDYFIKTGQTNLKCKTFKFDDGFPNGIRRDGWNFLRDESQSYKRHQPKLE